MSNVRKRRRQKKLNKILDKVNALFDEAIYEHNREKAVWASQLLKEYDKLKAKGNK